MECQNWIKLWRKVKDNKIFLRDHNAWHIFEYLLMTVDYKTGQWDTGRFIIANALFMNPNTVYAALKRLEKAKMITQVSNNKYSTISICKWKEYQVNDNNNDNNNITTRQQQDNTNKEIKNKRIVYSDTTIKIAKLMNLEPTGGLEFYINEKYSNYLFKEFTIHYIQWCKENKRKPTISQWMNWVRSDIKKGNLQTKSELGLEG